MGAGSVKYPPKISREAFEQAAALLMPGFNADDLIKLEVESGVVTLTLRCQTPEGAVMLGTYLTQEVHIQPDTA
jgi:hypothetical protein